MKAPPEKLFLMADDDDDDCILAHTAFRESGAEGTLACVSNGVELLEYLGSQNAPLPRLILLDLNMPRKDGREVLKEIKSSPAIADIPIVILTTSREQMDIETSMQNGATAFITKPETFGKWVEMMRCLRKAWLEAV